MQDYLKEHLALTKVYPADKGIELHLAALGLVAAMKKAGSTDPEAIAGALENLAFDEPHRTGPFRRLRPPAQDPHMV